MQFPRSFWLVSAVLGCLAIQGTPAPSLAQVDPPFNCKDPQAQLEMNFCAQQDYEAADRQLNQVYQATLPKFQGRLRQQLVTAQTRWIPFRDAECEFYGSTAEGGSLKPLLVAGCLSDLTRQRTQELQAYGQQRLPNGGDGSYERSDRQLNQVYKEIRQRLWSQRKPKLEQAELAWIRYRDAVCTFEGNLGGKAAQTRCLTRLTRQRIQQLKDHADLS